MTRFARVLPWMILYAVMLLGCSGGAETGGMPTGASSPTASSPTASPTAIFTAVPTNSPTQTAVHPSTQTPAPAEAVLFTYRVVNSYPHRADAFTQGLLYLDGALYESTGRRGQSTLRRVELQTGEPHQMRAVPLPEELLCHTDIPYTACLSQADAGTLLFGEGLAVIDDRLYQLTWQSGIGLIYDRASFELIDTFALPGEGWGLAFDGARLLLSDGSDRLTFLNPETLQPTGQVTVRDGEMPIGRLNELEVIEGEVWANIWQTERIARIDPHSGLVTGWVALDGLRQQAAAAEPGSAVDVLNGIAYDPGAGRIFVTGKYWPLLFEIEVVPAT